MQVLDASCSFQAFQNQENIWCSHGKVAYGIWKKLFDANPKLRLQKVTSLQMKQMRAMYYIRLYKVY